MEIRNGKKTHLKCLWNKRRVSPLSAFYIFWMARSKYSTSQCLSNKFIYKKNRVTLPALIK